MRGRILEAVLGTRVLRFSSLRPGFGASLAAQPGAALGTRLPGINGAVGSFPDPDSSWGSRGSCCSSIEIITGTRIILL